MKFTTLLNIAMSVAFFALGLTGNEFYKPFNRGEHTAEDRVPTWLGRTLFVIGGLFLAYSAFSSLRHR